MKSDSSHADQFIAASASILQTTTGDIGQKARTMSQQLVATVEGAEYSTSQHMTAIQTHLEHLSDELDKAKHAVNTSQPQLKECTQENATLLESLCLSVGVAQDAVAAISRRGDPRDDARATRVREMNARNEAFERTLRQDHEEFTRAHARRLTKAFQHQF
ncbi:hypothetical protein IWW50_005811 [Coemansia erecta]|nr:hypothetical protein GGF43_005347 [Coemansia sp. RSA 2618]KAJ2818469.1 hypothetical protein IWW50_005811 [Coemansia erecta]